uniref:Zinc finger protein 208 n=1 Tax=Culex pipiens TaxID=7175 RepID=A0A8D8CRB9_CULPI
MDNVPSTSSEMDPDPFTSMLLAPEHIKVEAPLDIPPERVVAPKPSRSIRAKPIRSFGCDRGCGKSFFAEAALVRHQASCRTACPECGLLLKSPRGLRLHMENRHKCVKPYECRVKTGCPERFTRMQDRRAHEVVCGKGAKVKERRCSVCDKSFPTMTMRVVHESKCGLTTQCQICGITTESVLGMVYHMNKHKGLAPFPCRKGGGCGERFPGPEARNSHEAKCNETGQSASEELPCLNCGEKFANHAHLLKHFKLCQFELKVDSGQALALKQEPEAEGLCQGCGQRFPSAGALGIHQIQCKLATTCTICSKEFKTNLGLTYHMNSHYGLLPFECRTTPGCPLRFSNPYRRLRHEQKCSAEMGPINTAEEPFRCETCKKVFSTAQKRDTHLMICELTTTCAICGNTTRSTQSMAYHMNMHRGIKPYECREGTGCGLRFYSPWARNNHKKVCKKNNKKIIDVETPVVSSVKMEASQNQTNSEDLSSVNIKQEVELNDEQMETSQNQTNADAPLSVQIKPEVEPDDVQIEAQTEASQNQTISEAHIKHEIEPIDEQMEAQKSKAKRCPGCNKAFASEAFLTEHRKCCVASRECWICAKKFATRESLKFHLNKHNGVNPYQCRVTPGCQARFYNSIKRNYHETDCARLGGSDESGQPNSLECPSCSAKFASTVALSQHQVRCNVPTVCIICGRTMASFTSLQYHMNKHKGLKPYHCSNCPAKYSNPGARNQHEQRCLRRKNPAGKLKPNTLTLCDRCGQDCRTVRQLRKHQNNCSVSKTCGICNRVLHSHNALRAHLNRHNNVKPYQCRESVQCGARFHASGQRNTHERGCPFRAKTSDGSGQITCEGCGKSFTKAVHLQSHETLCVGRQFGADSGEDLEELPEDPILPVGEQECESKPIENHEDPAPATWSTTSCVGCGEDFASTELLQSHKQSCGTKKTCTVCRKSVVIDHFEYHMNRHSGVNPYRCRVRDGCPAAFHNPWLRNKHERICRGGPEKKTDPEDGKCRRCGKELDRQTMLHVCEGLEVEKEEKVVKWSYTKEVEPSSVKVESVDVKVEVKKSVDEEDLLEVTFEQPVDLRFFCEACGKEFNSSELRNKHTSSCDKALPYQCRLSAECPERFANAQYRRNHEVICGKSRRLGGKSAKVELVACRNCGKVCNGKQLLLVHRELCGPEVELPAELRCTVCSEVSNSVEKLQKHLDEHNREKLLKCRASANCLESFKHQRTRIDHELECTAAGQTICSKCFKLLPNPDSLEDHEDSCQGDEFICRLCDATYSDVLGLRKHLLNHENPGQHARWWEKPTRNPVTPNRQRYSCENCGQEFVTQEELQKHPALCKFVYRCAECPAAFAKALSLKFHENMHTGAKPFECRKEGCTKGFANPYHRRAHEELCGTSKAEEHLKKVEQGGTSTAAKVFPCPHCTATFKAVNELKYHVNEHKANKMFPCRQSDDCQETFTTRGIRLKHEAICGKLAAPKQPRKVELIACKDCGKVFSNLQYLRIHKQKCAGSEEGPPSNLKCTLCTVISPDVKALQEHLDGHNREKPFQCRISKACSESYINERQRGNHELVCNADGQVICQRCFKLCPCLETLKSHEKTCRGTEFPCRLCEVVLRTRNSQLVHYLRHDNEKRQSNRMHVCPSCDKQFHKRTNFLLHLKEHNIDPSDLKLKCEICAATFKAMKTMEIHMNCHKGIKSYKCRYQGCEEAFFQSNAREVHEQNCTKVSLTCDICELKLVCMRDYQLHIRSHDAANSLEGM